MRLAKGAQMGLLDHLKDLFPERRQRFSLFFAVFATAVWLSLATASDPPCRFGGPTGADPKEFAFLAIPGIGLILARWLWRQAPDAASLRRDRKTMLFSTLVVTVFFWMGLLTTCNCTVVDADGQLIGEQKLWFNLGFGGDVGASPLCKAPHVWNG